MQIEIACRHGSVGEPVQNYIREKSEKLLTYFERVTQIQVTFDFTGNRVKAEILVNAEHKHDFVSHYEGEDAQICFDHALHKIEHQIKKYKEQLQDHRRDKPLNEIAESMMPQDDDDVEDLDDDDQ
ncbi:ribosome-associated translation inhibitor RaiA [Rubinisphaera sp.]|uniref:ribosome hibernation-promoting factor, HPF/YfiA family n=1 Tax=Rubinisphaera sp. TaxID=2024857 RepID=UPI000C0D224A|nr:ribosome-associated translation inhibitor RaiA [Rubinisphaera sp.]MBV10153.1 ribosomal subunit interface protein [Rubinisphaera sp.]HCS52463.1 ribosome-associated translation inhibitor RaiA [Planctomycetaceae bacterium]